MKCFRWGLVLLVVAAMGVSAGCEGFKLVRRGEYERLRSTERLNEQQSSLMTALIHDKERLTDEVNALRAQLGSSQDIIALLKKETETIRADLESKPDLPDFGGQYDVTQEPDGIGIAVGSDVLFDTGQDSLKADGKKALDGIVAILNEKPNNVRVCGYTDSTWTGVSKWKSNFELSGARALSVLDYLHAQGIEPSRMNFAGYGEHDLIYDSEGKEDKKKSRRVKVVLLYDWATHASGEASSSTSPAVTPK